MIKFGPAGNSDLFYQQGFVSSFDAPKWIHDLGLEAYEYSFSRGVRLTAEKAVILGNKCRENKIQISVHAPYYINLASTDEEKINKSFQYVLDSLNTLKLLGGNRCVFHPGTCGSLDRETAVNLMKSNMAKLIKLVKQNNLDDMLLCPETMGKSMQLGSYQEIAELCKIDDCIIPTLDFGHINCFTNGSLKGKEDYKSIIDYLINEIGYEKVKKIHIHFSKIEYGPKGEIRHLTLADTLYGPEFDQLAKVIKEYGLEPTIICESKGRQATDAIILKEIYKNA